MIRNILSEYKSNTVLILRFYAWKSNDYISGDNNTEKENGGIKTGKNSSLIRDYKYLDAVLEWFPIYF